MQVVMEHSITFDSVKNDAHLYIGITLESLFQQTRLKPLKNLF
jgi:hypothetical protein